MQCSQQFTAPSEDSRPPSTANGPTPTRPEPLFAREHPSVAGATASERKHCLECGTVIRRRAVVCPACGVAQPTYAGPTEGRQSKRILAGVLAIVLGTLGVHKFVLGYAFEGVIMLVLGTVGGFCFGIGTAITFVVGVIEGIIYLTKTDAEFHSVYEVNKRGWF